MAVEGHLWLWRSIYKCGGPCIAVEGMDIFGGLCMRVGGGGHVILWRALYSFGSESHE